VELTNAGLPIAAAHALSRMSMNTGEPRTVLATLLDGSVTRRRPFCRQELAIELAHPVAVVVDNEDGKRSGHAVAGSRGG
jgi:hypothetical protein